MTQLFLWLALVVGVLVLGYAIFRHRGDGSR